MTEIIKIRIESGNTSKSYKNKTVESGQSRERANFDRY